MRTALLLLAAAAAAPAAARAAEVAFERDTTLPIVTLNIAVKAGAAHDPAGRSGLANFVGEMLLRGSTARTKDRIDEELDQMGASLECETRADSIVMRGSVLSSQLEPYLRLVHELLVRPSFPAHEIRKLKAEILSGIAEEQGRDGSLMSRRFLPFLFQGHPYGVPISGKSKDVTAIARADVLKQYDLLFRDSRFVVVGAGDAPEERIREFARALGAARPGGAALPELPVPQDAPARRLMIVDKPSRTQTQVAIGQIGVRMDDPRYFPLYLGNFALGGGSFSSRLMVEIRVKRGWSYGANSSFRHGVRPRSWTVGFQPASKDAAPALERALAMIEELRSGGLTAEELEFHRASLVNSAGFMYDTPRKRVENRLLEKTLLLPDGFMRTYADELRKLTLAQVNGALAEYLKPDRVAIGVLATAAELKEPLAKAAGVPVEKVVVRPYTEE